ncbi:MAG: hypothetical protein AAB244_02735, partial [Nitrospirota bacterium]
MAGIPPFVLFLNVRLFPLPDGAYEESLCYCEVLWIRSAIPEEPTLIPGAAYVNFMSLPFIRLAEEQKARERQRSGAAPKKNQSRKRLKCLPDDTRFVTTLTRKALKKLFMAYPWTATWEIPSPSPVCVVATSADSLPKSWRYSMKYLTLRPGITTLMQVNRMVPKCWSCPTIRSNIADEIDRIVQRLAPPAEDRHDAGTSPVRRSAFRAIAVPIPRPLAAPSAPAVRKRFPDVPAGKMTVEQAAKRLKRLTDIGSECNINLLECVQTIICRASRPERRLGTPFVQNITRSLVTSGTIPAIIYSAKAQVSFPAVWQAMLAKDAGFSSYEAYTMNRKFSGIPHECAPPMAWVKAYINFVNTQAWTHWDIQPDPANSSAVHSAKALANHPSLDKGERMTLDKIVYIDLFAAVKSHILHAASLGHDVTPFLRTEENL